MGRIEIESGTKYGRLEVLKEVYSPRRRKFLCRCSCGRTAEVRMDHLRNGHSQTCGKCGVKLGKERKSVAEWARIYGIKESTLRARMTKMSISNAIALGPAD